VWPLSKTDALKPTAQNLAKGYLAKGYRAKGYLAKGYRAERVVGA